MSIGYLSCAFDLLNVGDLDVIAQARQRCDRLVVGVRTDDEVRRLTGREPVVPFDERIELVRHVRGIDVVVEHDGDARERARGEIVFVVDDSTDMATDDHVTGLDHSGGETSDRTWTIVPRRATASLEVRAALAPVAGAA